MRNFSFRIFGFWLIVFNTISYFAFRSIKGYSTWPLLLLIIIGLVCYVGSFIPFKNKE